MKTDVKKIRLPEVVGKGYKEFWNFKGRYRVIKGSRASKKSKTMALWSIVSMIKYPEANMLVIRKTERTLRSSCFSDLKWAIHRLGVDDYFKCTLNPLEIIYLPTGQKILFRGLDDPLKITSITVEQGVLCFAWFEEAYEITSEADFDTIDESIRGEVPPGLFKQITLTLNPWSDKHWIKKRFFDNKDADILAKTTNYLCNEWLDEADKRLFERMRVNNPKRYKVAGLGEWGIVDGLIYERWREEAFDVQQVSAMPGVQSLFGLDFGYTNDETALFCGLIHPGQKKLWVFDELYEKALTNNKIYNRIFKMGYSKERIVADCAEPKSIDELRGYGLRRIQAARKGKDSINNGIQYLQDFEIIIHPRCVNFITEISNYVWDVDKLGNRLNKPIDDFNHLMDAMRYGADGFIRGAMEPQPIRVNY